MFHEVCGQVHFYGLFLERGCLVPFRRWCFRHYHRVCISIVVRLARGLVLYFGLACQAGSPSRNFFGNVWRRTGSVLRICLEYAPSYFISVLFLRCFDTKVRWWITPHGRTYVVWFWLVCYDQITSTSSIIGPNHKSFTKSISLQVTLIADKKRYPYGINPSFSILPHQLSDKMS